MSRATRGIRFVVIGLLHAVPALAAPPPETPAPEPVPTTPDAPATEAVGAGAAGTAESPSASEAASSADGAVEPGVSGVNAESAPRDGAPATGPTGAPDAPAVSRDEAGDAAPPRVRRDRRRAAQVRADEAEKGPPVLFGHKVSVGGYGGLKAAYTRMFDEDGALLGMEGAVLFDHRLSLGVAGYLWTNPQPGPDDRYGGSRHYQTGYLGAALRYSLLSDSPIYLTLGALVGSGAVVLAPDHTHDDDDDRFRDEDDVRREDVDVFAVVQPEASLNANVTRWLRVGLSGGYRFTANVSRFGMSNEDLNGVVIGGSVEFGRF